MRKSWRWIRISDEEFMKEHNKKKKIKVSNYGEFRRYNEDGGYKVLEPYTGKSGYLSVNLYVGKLHRLIPVHRAVAETFISLRPKGLVTDHIDGEKQNNRVDNLQFITNRENLRKGRGLKGLKLGPRLPPAEVKGLRILFDNGYPCNVIAKVYNRSEWTVRVIGKRAVYKHKDYEPSLPNWQRRPSQKRVVAGSNPAGGI